MIAAAGGGDGGTDWSTMTIPEMQALIQNPNTGLYYDLLTGWKRSYELLGEHMGQVKSYRENLAAAWPPEKSAASAAYLSQLDEMLTNLNETYEAAMANHTAFAAATLSVGLAQHDMQPIFDEYQANDQLLIDFTNVQQQRQNGSTPLPSPGPSGAEPPVAPGRQEELRQKAITLMSSVSSDLVQSQVKIVTPPTYVPQVSIGEKTTPNNGTKYTPPPIPPITPFPVTDGRGSPVSPRPSTSLPRDAGTAQPGLTSPSAGQPGLVLGGTTTPVVSPPSTGLGPTFPTGNGGPVSNPGLLPTTTTPFLPGGGSLPPIGTGVNRGLTIPNEGAVRSGGGITEGIRAMPPGGIIGGAPGVGLGQPGATRAGVRRINPVGGVIGEGEPGARSSGLRRGTGGVGGYDTEGMMGGGGRSGAATGRGTVRGTGRSRGIPTPERASGLSGPGMSANERAAGGAGTHVTFPKQQQYGQTGGRRGGQQGESESNRWDPDNPWETEKGVAPVVIPAKEQRIDPGPAIGLS